jgi:CBS-domain-containing membrane protein
MSSPTIYQTDFPRLAATDTVGAALDQMLGSRISDLPVVDASGALVGMFKLEKLYAKLLPRAALLGKGMQDLSFVSDTLDEIRGRMRDIQSDLVGDYVEKVDQVVHPDTPPVEIVLLLHNGANNVPVVDRDSRRLVGMVSSRDLLAALHEGAGT